VTGIQWAPEMPENGRLAQSEAARMEGVARVCDPLSTCNQTLRISLFFDGTNNNDDETIPRWVSLRSRTSKRLSAIARTAPKRVRLKGIRLAGACAASALMLSLSACGGVPSATVEPLVVEGQPGLISGGVSAFNYSTAYIHSFGMVGPGNIRGGGPNVMPVKSDGRRSGGGAETCCMTFPLEWRPDLTLTVRWLAYKLQEDKKVTKSWHKAENVRIQQYDGQQAGGVWAIFLPGDRVKIIVTDGNANGHNTVAVRPADDDPYVAQGAVDDEWNRLYRKGGSQ